MTINSVYGEAVLLIGFAVTALVACICFLGFLIAGFGSAISRKQLPTSCSLRVAGVFLLLHVIFATLSLSVLSAFDVVHVAYSAIMSFLLWILYTPLLTYTLASSTAWLHFSMMHMQARLFPKKFAALQQPALPSPASASSGGSQEGTTSPVSPTSASRPDSNEVFLIAAHSNGKPTAVVAQQQSVPGTTSGVSSSGGGGGLRQRGTAAGGVSNYSMMSAASNESTGGAHMSSGLRRVGGSAPLPGVASSSSKRKSHVLRALRETLLIVQTALNLNGALCGSNHHRAAAAAQRNQSLTGDRSCLSVISVHPTTQSAGAGTATTADPAAAATAAAAGPNGSRSSAHTHPASSTPGTVVVGGPGWKEHPPPADGILCPLWIACIVFLFLGAAVVTICVVTTYGVCYCTQPKDLSTWLTRRMDSDPAFCPMDDWCHVYTLVGQNCTELVLVGHMVLGDNSLSILGAEVAFGLLNSTSVLPNVSTAFATPSSSSSSFWRSAPMQSRSLPAEIAEDHRVVLHAVLSFPEISKKENQQQRQGGDSPSIVAVLRATLSDGRVIIGGGRIESLERRSPSSSSASLSPETYFEQQCASSVSPSQQQLSCRVLRTVSCFGTAPLRPNETVQTLSYVGGGDYRVSGPGRRLLALGMRHAPNSSFYYIGGDLAYANNMRRCYRRWDTYFYETLGVVVRPSDYALLPILAAPGNHEGGGYLQASTASERGVRFQFYNSFFPHYRSTLFPTTPASPSTASATVVLPWSAEDWTVTAHAHVIGPDLAMVFLDSDIMMSASSQRQYLVWAMGAGRNRLCALSLSSSSNFEGPDSAGGVFDSVDCNRSLFANSSSYSSSQTEETGVNLTAIADHRRLLLVYHNPAFPSVRGSDDPISQSIKRQFVPVIEQVNDALRAAALASQRASLSSTGAIQGRDPVAMVLEHHDHAYKRTRRIRSSANPNNTTTNTTTSSPSSSSNNDEAGDPYGLVFVGDGALGATTENTVDFHTGYIQEAADSRYVMIGKVYVSSGSIATRDRAAFINVTVQVTIRGPTDSLLDQFEL